MKIIALSGKAESGKTYTANIIRDYFESNHINARIYSLATLLKEQATELGWNGEKDEKGREFLQSLGKAVKAYNGLDYYAKKLAEKICDDNIFDNVEVAIIDDLRLMEEINYLKSIKFIHSNLIPIRIIRPNHENKLTDEQRKDISEVGLDDYDFKYIFLNNGTNEYKTFIKEQIEIIFSNLFPDTYLH